MQVNVVESIGFVAAACTTSPSSPQLTKIRKQGGRDLSYAMLSVYLFGLALWLAYGILLHALLSLWQTRHRWCSWEPPSS